MQPLNPSKKLESAGPAQSTKCLQCQLILRVPCTAAAMHCPLTSLQPDENEKKVAVRCISVQRVKVRRTSRGPLSQNSETSQSWRSSWGPFTKLCCSRLTMHSCRRSCSRAASSGMEPAAQHENILIDIKRHYCVTACNDNLRGHC